MKPYHITVCQSEDQWVKEAKERAINGLQTALQTYDTCRFGVAGGNTPKRLYQALGNSDLPWKKVECILTDERYVLETDHESNKNMVQVELMSHINIPRSNFLSFDTSLPWEESALQMEQDIKRLIQNRRPLFDVLVLGMGQDGHIASLFPNCESLNEKERYALTVTGPSELATRKRLTLTLKALCSTQQTLIIIHGQEKKHMLDILLTGEADQRLPIVQLMNCSEVTFIVEDAGKDHENPINR